jgi:hypothetical protein
VLTVRTGTRGVTLPVGMVPKESDAEAANPVDPASII